MFVRAVRVARDPATVARHDRDDDFDDLPLPPKRRFERPEPFEAFSTDDPEAAAIFEEPLPAGAMFGGSRTPRPRGERREPRQPRHNEALEDAIRVRLRTAGHQVTFRGDALLVDGNIIGTNLRKRLLRHRDHRDPLRDDDAFADVVHTYLLDVLKAQAKAELKRHSRNAYLKRRSDGPGFIVMQANRQIATVTASSFKTSGGEYERGPFYGPGEHWDTALTLLLPRHKRPKPKAVTPSPSATPAPTVPPSKKPPAVSKPPEIERDRFIRWPDDAPEDLKALACAATPLLREQRIRADADPVELIASGGTVIAFEPVRRHKSTGRLDLPFAVRTDAGEVAGHIYLKSPQEPLTIYLATHEGNISLPWAWATALTAAADRYCGRPSDPDDEMSQPVGFHADGPTRDILRHKVPGHRRRLLEGQHAGDDAVKAAEEVDIDLPDGYTWVKDHFRGGKDMTIDGALRFRWTSPAERESTS